MQNSWIARLYFPAILVLYLLTSSLFGPGRSALIEFLLFLPSDYKGLAAVGLALYVGLHASDQPKNPSNDLMLLLAIIAFAIARHTTLSPMGDISPGFERIFPNISFAAVTWISIICYALYVGLNGWLLIGDVKNKNIVSANVKASPRETIIGFLYLPVIIGLPLMTLSGWGGLLLGMPLMVVAALLSIYILRLYIKALAAGRKVNLLPMLAVYIIAVLAMVDCTSKSKCHIGIEALMAGRDLISAAWNKFFSLLSMVAALAFIVLNLRFICKAKGVNKVNPLAD